MSAEKVRLRRRTRHLPDGTVVVEEHERPTNTAPVDERPYASTKVWMFNNGKFEAVERR